MNHMIAIVEDDPKIASLLQSHIQKYGSSAVIIHEFDQVLTRFQEISPHLVLMDINLPSFDGYYWCRQIRQISTCPIIFLSARSGSMDQVMALDNGGDDFITKPFEYEVVMAKIRSQLRRVYGEYAESRERTVELEGLTLYPERLALQLHGQEVLLSKKEAILIELLLTRSPRVVSRDLILEKLWDDSFVDDNTLSVNITRVRKRLAELGAQEALETVRGLGYRLLPVWRDAGGRAT